MNTDLLNRLLARDEGQFLEFKSAYERPGGTGFKRRKATEVAWDIAETLSAMANADGGTLLLGVEDDKTVTGVDYPDDKLDLFRQATHNLLQPLLSARLTEVSREEGVVWAFEVGPSPVPHQLSDGRYLLRVQDQNLPFPADQIAALKRAKANGQYERQFVHEARFEDLDQALLARFVERLEDARPIEEILYRDYRLIDYHDGRPRLTRAALLLFAQDPLRWHPRCGIDFVKFESTHFSRNPLLVRVLTDLGYMRDLGEGIPRMFEVMERNYLHPPEFSLDDFMFQVTLKNTPIYDLETQRWLQQFADYPLNQRQRRILAYARQHGDTFTNQAYQKVSNVDRDLAYREIQEMIGMGIVGRPSGRYSRTYRVVEPSAPPPIPEELEAILDLLRQQEYVVNKDLREVWGVSRVTAWRKAKVLITEGFLRQEGEKRSTRYHPTDKLEEILRNT